MRIIQDRSFSLTKNEEDQGHSNDNIDDHYFYFSRVNSPSEVAIMRNIQTTTLLF